MKRSISDWLAHAASAPAEVERCLDEAIALAESFYDWRTILQGAVGLTNLPRARLAAIADRTLALAVAEHEVWGFRDAAAARAAQLEDAGGARAALDAGEAAFREAGAHGYEWVLLGRGYAETLSDEAGLRRCLEAGRDMARARADADDLLSVATEWAARVERAEGLALVREAEALARNGSAVPWSIANAWSAVGEPESAARALHLALRAATETAAALHVAKAWASHDDLDEAARAVAKAAELAESASDWLDVGETAFDAGLDEARIRGAIENAERLLADDEGLRGRVSSAYKVWVGDEEAAARVGPRGVRPDALRARVTPLEGWESSASALFDGIRARATPELLVRLAHADYGMDAEKHLAALRDICETGLVPRALAWEPHEVLALARWSTGEGVDHLERALACVLLCLAPGSFDELVTNGPILAESCLALGAEARRGAELLFAWCAETDEDERPIALLLLFLLHAADAPDDPRLEPLARALLEHPWAERIPGTMRADLWHDLFDRILVPLKDSHAHVAALLRARP